MLGARGNGLTRDEPALHSVPYAGFPAAGQAMGKILEAGAAPMSAQPPWCGFGLRHEPPWKVIVKPVQEAHWYIVWLPGSVSCLDQAYALGQCDLIASL